MSREKVNPVRAIAEITEKYVRALRDVLAVELLGYPALLERIQDGMAEPGAIAEAEVNAVEAVVMASGATVIEAVSRFMATLQAVHVMQLSSDDFDRVSEALLKPIADLAESVVALEAGLPDPHAQEQSDE